MLAEFSVVTVLPKATAALPLKDITIDNVFIDVNNQSYKGKWLVVFFYPKDFTFVCPTEITVSVPT